MKEGIFISNPPVADGDESPNPAGHFDDNYIITEWVDAGGGDTEVVRWSAWGRQGYIEAIESAQHNMRQGHTQRIQIHRIYPGDQRVLVAEYPNEAYPAQRNPPSPEGIYVSNPPAAIYQWPLVKKVGDYEIRKDPDRPGPADGFAVLHDNVMAQYPIVYDDGTVAYDFEPTVAVRRAMARIGRDAVKHPDHRSVLARHGNPSPKENPPQGADRDAVIELVVFAPNDYDLWMRRRPEFLKNMARKIKSGRIDYARVPKLWEYFADEVAQKYTKDFGGGHTSFGIFTKADRRAAAQEFADEAINQFKSGEITVQGVLAEKNPTSKETDPDAVHSYEVFDLLNEERSLGRRFPGRGKPRRGAVAMREFKEKVEWAKTRTHKGERRYQVNAYNSDGLIIGDNGGSDGNIRFFISNPPEKYAAKMGEEDVTYGNPPRPESEWWGVITVHPNHVEWRVTGPDGKSLSGSDPTGHQSGGHGAAISELKARMNRLHGMPKSAWEVMRDNPPEGIAENPLTDEEHRAGAHRASAEGQAYMDISNRLYSRGDRAGSREYDDRRRQSESARVVHRRALAGEVFPSLFSGQTAQDKYIQHFGHEDPRLSKAFGMGSRMSYENPPVYPTYTDDEGDTIYVLPVRFTGNIDADLESLWYGHDWDGTRHVPPHDMQEFLYGELGSDEGISDSSREHVYWGSDVQDFIRAQNPPRRENPLQGYERTKSELKDAARLIDEGSYRAADQTIRGSGASLVDLENLLGKARIAKMRKWMQRQREGNPPRSLAALRKKADQQSFGDSPVGSGGRFKECVKVMRAKDELFGKTDGKEGEDIEDPDGLCAAIGRRKYGAKKMAAMAQAGRRRNMPNPPEFSDFGYLVRHGRKNPPGSPVPASAVKSDGKTTLKKGSKVHHTMIPGRTYIVAGRGKKKHLLGSTGLPLTAVERRELVVATRAGLLVVER